MSVLAEGALKKLAKKAKHSDAVMTGILVTKFKMGQIDVKDLENMAADATRIERCSAAKKVLEAVRDSPDFCAKRLCWQTAIISLSQNQK
jgi:hypothetical protein